MTNRDDHGSEIAILNKGSWKLHWQGGFWSETRTGPGGTLQAKVMVSEKALRYKEHEVWRMLNMQEEK